MVVVNMYDYVGMSKHGLSLKYVEKFNRNSKFPKSYKKTP